MDEDTNYRYLVPTDEIAGYKRVTQADGKFGWITGNDVDLAGLMETDGFKRARITALGSYHGTAFKLTVPRGAVPSNTQIIVRTPFVLEPSDFDAAIKEPGATTRRDGLIHSDVQQRMLVSSARLVSVNEAGDAEYALDAYCIDEGFAPPEATSAYGWSKAHQGIATDTVKSALRTTGDSLERVRCVWAVVAGNLSPGMCR